MVEETEYDDVVTCKHSYSEKCHTTYTTDFEPQQEEECNENFVKNCFIEFRKAASDEKVTICHTPIELVGGGPEVCQTVYESACTTTYEQHDVDEDEVECETITEEKCEDVTQGYTTEQKCTKWPVQKCKTARSNTKKYSPVTNCKKVPREVCGPGTEQVPGAEECFDRVETAIIEVNYLIIYYYSTLFITIKQIASTNCVISLFANRFHLKHVTWSLKESVNMLQSLSQSSNHLKNVLTFQLKHVLAPELTHEKFKSQLSRNGVTFQLLNLVLLRFNDMNARIL